MPVDKYAWDVPYVPPGGLVLEGLLPDNCPSCLDPIMQRPLEPLRRFDHPQLRQAPPAHPDRDPLTALRFFMRKQCAGLAHRWRPDIAGLRLAFHTGDFTEQHAMALDWAFSGMRAMYVFPGLVAGARLPIFEVARCFWTLFEGDCYGCGPWLNQWADDPDRPHPAVQTTPLVRVPPETDRIPVKP